MAEPAESGKEILGLSRTMARSFFLGGVVLLMLMIFIERASIRKILATQSELDQVRTEMGKPLPPVAPVKPIEPGQNEADYAEHKKVWDAAVKEYEEERKEWEEEMKAYRVELREWQDEYELLKNEEERELEQDIRELRAEQNDGALARYLFMFIAVLLMLVGLSYVLLHGGDFERAAALVLIGWVLLELLFRL